MARREKKKIEPASIEYMLTYGDMVTLLLCFFVVMLSMASLEEKGGMKMILSAFRGGFGIMEGGPSLIKQRLMTMGMEMEALSSKKGVPMVVTGRQAERGWRRYPFGDKVSRVLREEITRGAVKICYHERGVVVQLTNKALFDSGKADIKPSSRPILDRVAGLIATIPNQIRVEGHTDDAPTRGLVFPSNWELSVARATNVLRFFEEIHHIPGERLSAAGYGPCRPIGSNDSPEGRAANRRVDIVIIREEAREEPKTID